MSERTNAPQRLQLHPEVFGQVFPHPREPLPAWLPEGIFVSVTRTEEEYYILCPQRFIPECEPQAQGLRVLYLQPRGALINEVVRSIDEDLRVRDIPASATCNRNDDMGLMVVSEEDLPVVKEILAESGHTVEEPWTP